MQNLTWPAFLQNHINQECNRWYDRSHGSNEYSIQNKERRCSNAFLKCFECIILNSEKNNVSSFFLQEKHQFFQKASEPNISIMYHLLDKFSKQETLQQKNEYISQKDANPVESPFSFERRYSEKTKDIQECLAIVFGSQKNKTHFLEILKDKGNVFFVSKTRKKTGISGENVICITEKDLASSMVSSWLKEKKKQNFFELEIACNLLENDQTSIIGVPGEPVAVYQKQDGFFFVKKKKWYYSDLMFQLIHLQETVEFKTSENIKHKEIESLPVTSFVAEAESEQSKDAVKFFEKKTISVFNDIIQKKNCV